MSEISIQELEAAINFWRARSPASGDELVLCKEASALSKPYALLIVHSGVSGWIIVLPRVLCGRREAGAAFIFP
ncbi:MAG: FIG00454030: hypothetical protein [uncultured Paraburkholderia sp.]|nr:MAG: FIG00454030: hypothetical protein [uncultured Paraburkholderia sp.]